MNLPEWRRAAVVALASTALLLPVATVHAEDSPSASPEAVTTAAEDLTFTVGITDDVDSLNPFTGIVSTAYEMYQLMYPTLTTPSAQDFTPVPDLAESWQESEDQTTWTYKIREGLKWSDGQPLTAEDAAYSFNRVLEGDYEQTNYGGYVANITKAEAPDATTLVLTVKEPTPLMENLAVYILPKHIWENIGEKQVRSYENEPSPGEPIVGAGPYVLTAREKGQFLQFEANPNYYAGEPAVKNLTFRVYKNADAVAQALRKGEIDFADEMQANVFDAIKDEDGITGIAADYYGFNEIGMNYGAALADGTPIGDGNPALKDRRVRQAINHAIDRQTLVDKVAVYGTPGSTIIPPLYANLHLDPANPFDYDPVRAGELLDEAGYTLNDEGQRVDADGNPLTLRLLGRQESQTSQQTVQFVEGWLEEIGIDIDTKIVSEDTLIELNGEGRFDLFEWGWVVEPDPDYQLSTFTCAQRSSEEDGTIYAGLSDSHFCNEEYDALYAQQAVETDPAARAEIVKQMQQIVYDEAPYAVTFYYDLLQAYRSDRFTNFVQQPTDSGPALFQFGTWSYQSMTPVTAEDTASGTGTESATAEDSSGGLSPGLIAGLVALVVVVVGGVVMLRRRSAGDEDTE